MSATPWNRSWSSLGAAMGVIAAAVADLWHEGAHALTALALGVPITALSSVGLQTLVSSRTVAAAGTLANLLAGVVALAWAPRCHHRATALFVWLLAAMNLFNVGYLAVSAVLRSGDWWVVIAGWRPALLWQAALLLAGSGLYALSVTSLARTMSAIGLQLPMPRSDWQRWVLWGYLASGMLLTLASVFNPYDVHLILISGLGGGFGLPFGLLLLRERVYRADDGVSSTTAPSSTGWWIAALVIGALFVAVMGPGIRFAH